MWNFSKKNVYDLQLTKLIQMIFEYHVLKFQGVKIYVKKMFHCLNGLYLREKCLLIDTIMKYQSRKKSAAEIEKRNREKSPEKK